MGSTAICNNCGASERTVIYGPGVAQEHQVVKCTNCGLMYAFPLQSKNLTAYEIFGKTADPMSFATSSVARSYDKLPDYEPIGLGLRRLLPAAKTLLEIGCHAGVLLDRFRRQGWAVTGVEPDANAAGFARAQFGLAVQASALENSNLEPSSFDAVVMLHVIEHLDDPACTIRLIRQLLRPGGILVVETPIYDTLMFRLLGKRERSLSCDGHIFFYTSKTLRALLERCGFEIIVERRVGRTVSLGRLLWNLGLMTKNATMQHAIERLNTAFGLYHRFKMYLNTRDMIRVFARKKDQLPPT
jgi:SAM-dependent methyltransferase